MRRAVAAVLTVLALGVGGGLWAEEVFIGHLHEAPYSPDAHQTPAQQAEYVRAFGGTSSGSTNHGETFDLVLLPKWKQEEAAIPNSFAISLILSYPFSRIAFGKSLVFAEEPTVFHS